MSEADPFRIRAHVHDFDLISEGYRSTSNAARARWRAKADIRYGPGSEDRLDLFFPETMNGLRPIHMFIHGGYWRANVKEDYAYLANAICDNGAIAAIVEYSRLPNVRMAALVDQVRRATLWLHENGLNFGGDPEAISASGHSAGAHLAFYLAAGGPTENAPRLAIIRSLFLVSGIYDLRPIKSSFLQAEIGLHEDEILEWSPLGATLQPGTHGVIAVGDRETAPFVEQAAALAHSASSGSFALVTAAADHMSIVRDMADPNCRVGQEFRSFLDLAGSA
jgi:arylformamidase